MVRGVFFDLDDTLIGFREMQRAALRVAWEVVFAERHPVKLETLQADFRTAYLSRFGYGTPGYAELAQISVRDLALRLAGDVARGYGIEDADDVARFASAWTEIGQRTLAVRPGAPETLRALRAARKKLGLITNGPSALQRQKLTMLALAELFEVVVIDSEFGHPKPDRRIFEHAAAAARLPPEALLFVGDSLPHDIAGALAAGWTAVWYNPEDAPLPPDMEPPHYTLRRLDDLLTLPPMMAVDRTGETGWANDRTSSS